MKILLSGATGFIGRSLCKALAFQGHDLVVLTRDPASSRTKIPAPHHAIQWPHASIQPEDVPYLKNLDAVIHLAGESIVSQRWDKEFKNRIQSSRVQGTLSVIELLKQIDSPPPRTMISASATGYYGDRGDHRLIEKDSPGSDFLAETCQLWENALFNSDLLETRKVALRIGIVLGQGGGALEEMIPAFRAGLGAPLGTGQQWMSWIHIRDLIAAFLECLNNPKISGPVNAVAPHPVSNLEFTSALTKALHSSELLSHLRVPGPLLRISLGEVAPTLLASQRVIPEKLLDQGFKYHYPSLKTALDEILSESYAQGYDEFSQACWIPRAAQEVFAFFSNPQNLEVITPPWLGFQITSQSTPQMQKGTLLDYQLKLHGLPLKWRTEITEWDEPKSFVDLQLKGPYQFWRHTHLFSELKNGTLIEDRVLYRIPVGFLGRTVAGSYVKKDIHQIFNYRTQKIFEIFP